MTAGQGAAAGSALALTIPARLPEVETCVDALRGLIAQHGLEGLAFSLELLAREALVNAVRHGCRSDPSRAVTMTVSLVGNGVRLCISDEGPGFDWAKAPRTVPDLDIETGRGLCIMHTYADTVEFNATGNMVCLTKRLPAEEEQMSDVVDGKVRITLETSISAQHTQALRDMFKERLLAGARIMELDLVRVGSVDSVGIGLLVATHNSLEKVGGSLCLSNVGQDIYQLLTLMRLDKHFSISQTQAGCAP